MPVTFPIANPKANDSLRKAVASYREGSSSFTFSIIIVGLFGIVVASVLVKFDDSGLHHALGLFCALISMGLLAAGLNQMFVAYCVSRGNKQGHVDYFSCAILHHTRGLLDSHTLGKFEQEFLSWVGDSQERFDLLRTGRSDWDAARSIDPPVNQAEAVRPLLLALETLILQFQYDPTRGKSKN